MNFLDELEKVFAKKNLSQKEAFFCLNEIAKGKANDFLVAAFLSALKTKGESEQELAGFAKAMRVNSVKVSFTHPNLVDTAGTGGDKKNTFNVSTCAAIVAAGAGAVVAKHGNRAVSGKTGSADVLEEMNIKHEPDPKQIELQLKTNGISFLFAPFFHPTFKKVSGIRKELGFKTVFNLLGPLSNPVQTKRQLIGVNGKKNAEMIAKAARILGTKKCLVVASDTDEISLSALTEVFEVNGKKIKKYSISPKDFGFHFSTLKEITVKSPTESAQKISEVLHGKNGACRDIVVLNAGAVLFAAGNAKSISQGVSLAEKSIDSGAAFRKLEAIRRSV